MQTLKEVFLHELKNKEKQCTEYDKKLNKEPLDTSPEQALMWRKAFKYVKLARMHLLSAKHKLQLNDYNAFPYTFGQACSNLGRTYEIYEQIRNYNQL